VNSVCCLRNPEGRTSQNGCAGQGGGNGSEEVKFGYFDESGMGSEPYLVVAGIVTDASRMHITKDEWAHLLATLSNAAGRTVNEFHSRDFYSGNGLWRGIAGSARAQVVDAILNWVETRKHRSVFSAIDKASYHRLKGVDDRVKSCKSMWCVAAMHCALEIQKEHQHQTGTKGHSVLIFDREAPEETDLTQLIHDPPEWIHTYYNRTKKQPPLDAIVDVPFFADSKHILLAQVADLFAYILRTSAEIVDGHLTERYASEANKMKLWSDRIADVALPRSSRYPARGRCAAAQLFWDLAPPTLRALR